MSEKNRKHYNNGQISEYLNKSIIQGNDNKSIDFIINVSIYY